MSGLQLFLVIAIPILLLIIIFFAWYISTLNRLRRYKIKVEEAESGIDVALTKRFDLLNKMVQAVRSYVKHERETLESIVGLRQPGAGASIAEKQECMDRLNSGFAQMRVIVENYPDLKANTNFLKMQDAARDVEENLQASRRIYNSNVGRYNMAIAVFPSSIVARRNNFEKLDMFKAEERKRQDVDLTV